MVLDIEITLNRFGFGRVTPNKFQIGFLRLSWWRIPNKYAVSFEINWRTHARTEDPANRPAR